MLATAFYMFVSNKIMALIVHLLRRPLGFMLGEFMCFRLDVVRK
ncbi:hypothetical protein S101447_02571 [Acetobacter ascendens]|uniref:Uncharacterized protein n=1 Tax=Acetobacter ascendens TaxID=481146 RepID=A0A1Y0V6T4_9PROT|nr:hypothetical protein S101447_02571 [Acetobacter ascendens]